MAKVVKASALGSKIAPAAECGFDSFPMQNAGLCVLSQSGETKDVIRVLERASEVGNKVNGSR